MARVEVQIEAERTAAKSMAKVRLMDTVMVKLRAWDDALVLREAHIIAGTDSVGVQSERTTNAVMAKVAMR